MDSSNDLFGNDYHPYHPHLQSIMHSLDQHVMLRNLEQTLLGFALTGNVTAMQRVFADQAGMVRPMCNHVVLTDACPHCSVLTIFPGPQVEEFLRTPFMLVGLCLAPRMSAAREKSGAHHLLHCRHCCGATLMQQCGFYNSLVAPGWKCLRS